MRQYLRKVTAEFSGGLTLNPGGIGAHQIKIGFDISKSISGTANTATIEIWNLNESHRNSMGREFDAVTLKAGYLPPEGGGNVGIIFKGAIRDVEHRRQNSDIVTKITCGDGDKALRHATVSKSYPKGQPIIGVVEDIFAALAKEGIARGEWKFPEGMVRVFARPYAVCGSCRRELDTLGRGHKFYWSLQNETMEIVAGDGFIGGTVVLTPETGLVGTPTITDNGIKVSALLNPEIRPNRRVQVKSQVLEMNAADGMYRVSSVRFHGDNMTGEFLADIVGEAIKGGKVDEGVK